MGAGIGITIYVQEALIQRNFFVLPKKVTLGFIVGIVSGLISFIIGQSFIAISADIPFVGIRIISWTIFGLCLGAATSFTIPLSKRIIIQACSGMIGGILGAISFELYSFIPNTHLAQLLGMIGLGILFHCSLIFTGTFSSHAYLRILTGRNEGQVYLLDRDVFSLGYLPENDIILRGYSEVCENHAYIVKNNDYYSIVNDYPGGQVFVNYRLVEQQNMKHGDIIKIGTALLQYGEIS